MDDRRLNIFNYYESRGRKETILIYPSIKTVIDPDEGTTTEQLLNPIPLQAIVNQLGMGALKWKYWGNMPVGSIEIIFEIKYYNAIINASKITYKGNDYSVYTDDAKGFSIIQRQDYMMAILERKNTER